MNIKNIHTLTRSLRELLPLKCAHALLKFKKDSSKVKPMKTKI